ncbi:MAG: HlyD family efflux transporter periplasmic adaptor subunit [Rhodothermales bacterium]
MQTLKIPGGIALAVLFALASGCGQGEPLSDAYGNFRATETIISAQTAGQLLAFSADEGRVLEAGQVVGLVDTTQLSLSRAQIRASRDAVRSRIAGVLAQIDVLETQRDVALREKQRVEQLLKDQAATPKQLDDIDGQLRVLDRQIQSIRTQNATILGEMEALDAQVALIDDQIRRSVLVNPIAGTVLATYTERYEQTAPGRPLYKIANLDTLELRAYISGDQLPHIRLGQPVDVLIDEDRTSNRTLAGEIVWIASEAEFTPKMIQTKAERVNLVYAIDIRVPNPDGALKIGMPGEARWE